MTKKKIPNPKKVAKALTPVVNELLVYMALASALREEVDGYKREVLEAGNYTDEYYGGRITEPSKDWHMGEDESPDYHAKVDAKVRAAGYDVPEGYCPALMAEDDQRKAERALIDASYPFFGVTTSDLLGFFKDGKDGLTHHREFLDLLIGLCVNFPGYKAPELPKPKTA